MTQMKVTDAIALKRDLLELFNSYDVNVAVGLTKDGVAIRSQDNRVDVLNIGIPKAQEIS